MRALSVGAAVSVAITCCISALADPITGDKTVTTPVYTEYTDRGSFGLPWFTDGASLNVPVPVAGDASTLSEASTNVHKVVPLDSVNAFMGITADQSNVTSLMRSATGNSLLPTIAQTWGLGVRLIFGAATQDPQGAQHECRQNARFFYVPLGTCDGFVASGGHVIPVGWTFSGGVRGGGEPASTQAQKFIGAEIIAEYTGAPGAFFLGGAGEYVTDETVAGTADVTAYGYSGGRLSFGGRLGHARRLGIVGRVDYREYNIDGRRDWSTSGEGILFGAWEQMRLGIGVASLVDRDALKRAGQSGTVISVWVSPGL